MGSLADMPAANVRKADIQVTMMDQSDEHGGDA